MMGILLYIINLVLRGDKVPGISEWALYQQDSRKAIAWYAGYLTIGIYVYRVSQEELTED